MDEYFGMRIDLRTIIEIIAAVFLLWIGSRLRRHEKKEERKANQKIHAKSQILDWVKECLNYMDEIKIKINANTFGTIKGAEEYTNLQRMETQGKLACGYASILGDDVSQKTKDTFTKFRKVLIAFKNRNGIVWDRLRELESSFHELITAISNQKN